MVEVQQTCINSCLVCHAPAAAYANPWKWHKLCEAHLSITDSVINCSLCQSQVKVTKNQSLTCDYCESSQDVFTLECNHCLCTKCNKNQSPCTLCEVSCSTCPAKAQVTYQNCRHLYCHKCRVKADTNCVICVPVKCYLCGKRDTKPFEKFCAICSEKCFICQKYENIKGKLDCEHLLCENCAIVSKNYCSLCQKNICENCILNGFCSKSGHIVCRKCSKAGKKYQCILCKTDQRCDFCKFIASTRPCHKGVHSICIECDHKYSFVYCELCKYTCCACSGVINTAGIIQNNCGHEICEHCFSTEPKPNCKRCPRTKDFYTCIVCRQEFWNKEHKIEVIKCLNCNERICTVCGNKVGFFGRHECQISFGK